MQPHLVLNGIYKTYESYGKSVHALINAHLEVEKGTIHGLLGENGAGKSTLMKILAGIISPNSGEIRIDGRPISIKNTKAARMHGIGMVHQHFSLIKEFTVLENVVLGIEPTLSAGILDNKASYERVLKVAKECGFEMDLDATVGTLSMGEQQKVEILRVLYNNANILIFDEPTSVLVEQEIQNLMGTLRSLRANGKTIIYISHKVEEVMEITDEVTVLRLGETVASNESTDTIDSAKMVKMMVGHDVPQDINRTKVKFGDKILSAKNICIDDRGLEVIKNVSFDIRSGEILALAGINGNGQQELIEALFGLRKISKGEVWFDGKNITNDSPRKRREAGIGYVPENRIQVGSCSDATIAENIAIDRYYKKTFMKNGWLNWEKMAEHSESLIKKFEIKAADSNVFIGALSGGHIQRTILAREFNEQMKLLLACEITVGLDVSSVHYIHSLMMQMREEGKTILLVSSNINEIMQIADRIIVIHEGELKATIENNEHTSKMEIGEYMLGLSTQQETEVADYEPA